MRVLFFFFFLFRRIFVCFESLRTQACTVGCTLSLSLSLLLRSDFCGDSFCLVPLHSFVQNLLRSFYNKHNPEKLATIAAVLTKYAGREELLFAMLDKKYGTVTDVSDEVAWASYQKMREQQEAASAAAAAGNTGAQNQKKGADTSSTVSTKGLSKREKRKLRQQRAAARGTEKAVVVKAAPSGADDDSDAEDDAVEEDYVVIQPGDGAASGTSAVADGDVTQCKTCGRVFDTRNELFRHLRKKCTPAPVPVAYFPGQTLNPDANKVVTRPTRKRKKKKK